MNKQKNEKVHILSGIIKCSICGAGMYGNKSIKHRKDGTRYRDFFYYGCKHRNMTRGHKCDYNEKINMQVDTSELDREIVNYEKQLRQFYNAKDAILADMDDLDCEDKHYKRRKEDMKLRLDNDSHVETVSLLSKKCPV